MSNSNCFSNAKTIIQLLQVFDNLIIVSFRKFWCWTKPIAYCAWDSRTLSIWSFRSCPSSDELAYFLPRRRKMLMIWSGLGWEIQFSFRSKKKVRHSEESIVVRWVIVHDVIKFGVPKLWGSVSSRVHIGATESWQLITNCTCDNLSE